jgi:hypothetical protein
MTITETIMATLMKKRSRQVHREVKRLRKGNLSQNQRVLRNGLGQARQEQAIDTTLRMLLTKCWQRRTVKYLILFISLTLMKWSCWYQLNSALMTTQSPYFLILSTA